MKAFAFGAVVGALICFVVIRVTSPLVATTTMLEQLPADTIALVTHAPDEPAACPDVRAISAPATQVAAQSAEPTRTLEPSAIGTRADSQAPSSGSLLANKRCLTVDTMSEGELLTIIQRANQLQQQRKQASKDAEPKDPGWAYSTELLIRQHIESQLPANRYTKLDIECRTTFCELKMTGTGTEGRDMADRLAKEIPRQPWSDIVQKGGGGGSNGDDWHLEYEWYRPRTESERKLWLGGRDSQ